MLRSECFSLPSDQAREALRLCQDFCSKFNQSENTKAACKEIVGMLTACIPPGVFGRLRREKMWKEFYEMRISKSSHTSTSSNLFINTIGSSAKTDLLYQHFMFYHTYLTL